MRNKWLAEALGTFALVFCGTGAIVINQETGGAVTHVGVAMTFGLIVLAMIYTLGDVSGAHLNPPVTVAFTVARRFPLRQLPPYILSQLAGAFGASGLLRCLFPANGHLGATLPAGSAAQSFVLELVLTLILVLVIESVATGPKERGTQAGLAIGATVMLEALFAGPICGASMNPARSLAPALVSGHTEHLWIYLTAPFLGAGTAVPLGRFLNLKS
ncbi:aquaporin [Flaviaesturariibacter aridisoli]|uniref:Aquaporin n=1 Tax=Flaviaesturariibacter aridisoli TaxID=2545761 RepID=A0A4R4E0C2_9BACT|nr:aquaporin [Flaviaesturariibacter aridisoli]TCZ72796.1 aquaporin [Flaviaesturariibacter aridisoli]